MTTKTQSSVVGEGGGFVTRSEEIGVRRGRGLVVVYSKGFRGRVDESQKPPRGQTEGHTKQGDRGTSGVQFS